MFTWNSRTCLYILVIVNHPQVALSPRLLKGQFSDPVNQEEQSHSFPSVLQIWTASASLSQVIIVNRRFVTYPNFGSALLPDRFCGHENRTNSAT
jgi:hypothetical protein